MWRNERILNRRCSPRTAMTLTTVLGGIGKLTKRFEGPDGSRLLVLPHGARVLGLFARASEENFFWTNPVLSSIGSARSFFRSQEWYNPGGDRTWLAPEIDIFFPKFP